MGKGEGGMIWENGIEIRIISYMERVASPGSMHNTGCLGLVHELENLSLKENKQQVTDLSLIITITALNINRSINLF